MVATGEVAPEETKNVGGVQLNFPGTSLLLLDWKYSKEFGTHKCPLLIRCFPLKMVNVDLILSLTDKVIHCVTWLF
jgi:hypothetical protein